MELNPVTPLHLIDGPVLLRLGAAAVLGLLLGMDRELRGHAAGMRTHGLICFTAALMTVCAIALHLQLQGGGNIDPLRVFEAAAAFTAIIAAGLIVFSKGEVRNLTTAAHIWLAAVIGIACGAALWPLVVSATIVAIIMLTVLGFVERRWLDPLDRTK
ncbi:MAG: MgtC/SapB family protein [Sphingobium sp.]|jgi:putative Mg2+ transporter-C (MgtC) family protein|uniref:Protein MgtC n=1 Tax=Sphingobium xenophagum TaxID=121428 RepID=A0A249MYD7_SPHXE|nr:MULTISPECIES: MgtC/SapB family protein [Sphingobium]MBU0775782.1 MgtC/SapB family protein [Alphaproteobacteria bacterium]ASY46348.1 MgtC/SapB family transporter [Sphingobium xenophagum]MBA4754819.1 MgtC/SapB family protein [Sphingobium sp.]MBS89572.1 MgtC/SapB family transporter [Sphingobium sp.]MBU0867694.1 MgtC/SapB family protein [Alphaproteobacteria bacterium]